MRPPSGRANCEGKGLAERAGGASRVGSDCVNMSGACRKHVRGDHNGAGYPVHEGDGMAMQNDLRALFKGR